VSEAILNNGRRGSATGRLGPAGDDGHEWEWSFQGLVAMMFENDSCALRLMGRGSPPGPGGRGADAGKRALGNTLGFLDAGA